MARMTTLRGVAQAPRNTQAVGNIDIQNIPDSAFIPVKRHRNIVTAFIANKQQDGSRRQADIAIVTPLGDQGYITRQELLSKYVYVQNRAINLHAWRQGKKYIVYQRDSSTMYAMQVPTNLTASVNGKMANLFKKDSGDYIVCYCGADGKVDKRTAAVISSKMFHKMFSIPMNDVIQKHRGSGNKFFTPQGKYLTAPPAAQQGQNQRVNGLTLQSTARQQATNQGQQQQRLNPMQPRYDINAATLPGVSRDVARPLTAQTVNPYKTVGRIMNGSKRVGFIILVNGKPRQVTDNQMLKLVASGKITDVMVQQTSNGYNYFRGNGIVIDNLPSRQVGQGMGNGNRGQQGGFNNQGQNSFGAGQQPGQSGFGAGGFGAGGFGSQAGQNSFGAGGFGSQAGQNSFGAGGFGSARQGNNNGGFDRNF